MRSSGRIESDGVGYYSDPPLLVLASLASGPKHGHAMLDDIEQISGMRLGPGTLYGAIGRLEKQGLIKALPAEDRRRPYELTEFGRSSLMAKMNTLQRVVAVGTRRLGLA